jgi:thymidylate kinase
MIKISFSGISGSGKTSLLQEVKKILSLKYRVDYVPEISVKNPFDNDRKSSFTSQFFYLSTQINDENVHIINPLDYLLCDRSVLDQWIYWKSSVLNKKLSENLESKHTVLENLYRFWIKTYDLVFLIRLDLKKLDSREFDKELRKIDSEYIKKREEIYLNTIKEDNLKVFEIWNNNTIDESAHQIVKTITEYKQVPDSAE